MTSANSVLTFKETLRQKMIPYLYVTLGSALGGLLRYALTRLTINLSSAFPFGTILINVLGSFVIGYFGTLTLHGSRYQVSENTRLFVMVGLCGGFTTFSSFSLQSFDLARSGHWARALTNVTASVLLCFAAVAAGHLLAHHTNASQEITQTREEEFTG